MLKEYLESNCFFISDPLSDFDPRNSILCPTILICFSRCDIIFWTGCYLFLISVWCCAVFYNWRLRDVLFLKNFSFLKLYFFVAVPFFFLSFYQSEKPQFFLFPLAAICLNKWRVALSETGKFERIFLVGGLPRASTPGEIRTEVETTLDPNTGLTY